jgi:hypothetical protein
MRYLRLIALVMLLVTQLYLAYSVHERRVAREKMLQEWRSHATMAR